MIPLDALPRALASSGRPTQYKLVNKFGIVCFAEFAVESSITNCYIKFWICHWFKVVYVLQIEILRRRIARVFLATTLSARE